MIFFAILFFLACCGLLYLSGEWLVDGLSRVARFLGWREFVVACFLMSLATSVPNLFVGISSALHKIPQLSFGDVVGSNVLDLTLAIALATLVAGGLSTESKLIQKSALFTISVAILPIILILDGVLGRGDGIILLLVFVLYSLWIFSKKERFSKIYDCKNNSTPKELGGFLRSFGKMFLGIILLLAAAEGIVRSATFISVELNISVALVGILIVSLGTSLPETYFAIASAKRGQTWMLLGNIMGSVIMMGTLVLGIVSLICPIQVYNFSPFIVARIFVIMAALFFLLFLKSDNKITKREAIFLIVIYLLFVIAEVLEKH